MVTLKLYRVKEVRTDYIVLADDSTELTITFADRQPGDGGGPIKKEEFASFFKHVQCQIGLESTVVPLNTPRTINIFLDHFVDHFGWLRSIPFPFPVSRVEIRTK